MGLDQNKEMVLELYRRMNARQYAEMWALFTPDARWGGGRASSDEFGSIDGMRAIMVDPMPIFTDGAITFTVHALTAEGDRVAAEVESYAPLVTGSLYNNHYHMLFEFRDGRIAVVKEYADTAHARDVFGDLGIA
jgi:ketosteroid isomerase-like protein